MSKAKLLNVLIGLALGAVVSAPMLYLFWSITNEGGVP